MKKNIIAVYMAVLSVIAFAQSAGSDFIIDKDGIITKYDGFDTVLVIPESVNKTRVTGIGERAFEKIELTSVTIGNSVTHIGDSTFGYEFKYNGAGTYTRPNTSYGSVWTKR